MSVWERGAGPTLACGTGACALVLAGYINDKNDKEVKVHLPGGDLDIKIVIERLKDFRIFMTGAADIVFQGSVSLKSTAFGDSVELSTLPKSYEKSSLTDQSK